MQQILERKHDHAKKEIENQEDRAQQDVIPTQFLLTKDLVHIIGDVGKSVHESTRE